MSEFVLDASAVLALLNDEPGAEYVRECLSGDAMISVVNHAEIISKLVSNGMAEDHAVEAARFPEIPLVPFDEAQAERTGMLHGSLRRHGLSFADTACLALAMTRDGVAITADRLWETVSLSVEVRTIR